MKKILTLLIAGFMAGCAAPPKPLTPATNPATTLLRLSEELELLAPTMLKATEGPLLAYWVFPDTPPKSAAMMAADAAAMLRESPDLINRMMETAPSTSVDKADRVKKDIGDRLRKVLQERPDLDLAWYWLAETEPTDSAAITDLTRAIRLNAQIGEYYQRRGFHRQSLHDYRAGIADLQRAVPFFHPRWNAYRELADLYLLAGDHARYLALWEQRQHEMQQALAQFNKSGPPNGMERLDQGQLRNEINYGYLVRAEYYIRNRHQPNLACPDLQRAVAAGVAEARPLQKAHCR